MILSKARVSLSAQGDRCYSSSKLSDDPLQAGNSGPYLHLLLASRDYTGAIAFLQLKHLANVSDVETLEWLAYCHFHHGEHDKALDAYKKLLSLSYAKPIYYTYCSACLFYMALLDEAKAMALKGPSCCLQIRILFHIAHKEKDEDAIQHYQELLGNSAEDQLSLASAHYLQMNYQDAADIYKRLLLEHRDWLALNVYVALCYYNLDFHDVSLEILNPYVQAYPESAVAKNLKACNKFKLWGGKAASTDLRLMKDAANGPIENELLQHNLVVLKQGEGASQVLPRLMDIFPEARLNLVIYHLQNNDLQQAYELVRILDPSTPQEYILKATACASIGQDMNSGHLLQQAQQLFQFVGSSASDCDTIPGRQSMASFFFLSKQFDDVVVYLKSIKEFCECLDEFKWNYGIANASLGEYKEAIHFLSQISTDKFLEDCNYHAWLCHCLIMDGKAHLAWDRYLQLEAANERFSLLQLIANEFYEVGQFLYAAKAFGILVQSDESQEHWEGLRGACAGVFQKIIMRAEPEESLMEIIVLLKSSTNSQAAYMSNVIQKWARENIRFA